MNKTQIISIFVTLTVIVLGVFGYFYLTKNINFNFNDSLGSIFEGNQDIEQDDNQQNNENSNDDVEIVESYVKWNVYSFYDDSIEDYRVSTSFKNWGPDFVSNSKIDQVRLDCDFYKSGDDSTDPFLGLTLASSSEDTDFELNKTDQYDFKWSTCIFDVGSYNVEYRILFLDTYRYEGSGQMGRDVYVQYYGNFEFEYTDTTHNHVVVEFEIVHPEVTNE